MHLRGVQEGRLLKAIAAKAAAEHRPAFTPSRRSNPVRNSLAVAVESQQKTYVAEAHFAAIGDLHRAITGLPLT